MAAYSDRRKFRWISFAIIMAIVVVFELGYNNFGLTFRVFVDYYDRSDFLHIGNWIINNTVPYVDTVVEYPQITVLFFGLINWLAKTILPSTWPMEVGFMILWYPVMGIFLWISMGQVWRLLPEGRKNITWLLLLPASIYFTMNRFDIIPVVVSLLGVTALSNRRYLLASLLLGVGIFIKWYLAFFVIPFLIYEWLATSKLPWKSVVVMIITVMIIILPTLLIGGPKAVIQPYAWHLNRLVEPGTLLWFFYRLLGSSDPGWIRPGILATVFTVVSLSGFLLGILFPVNSIRKVILVSAMSIIPFMLFGRIFSPQWWIWLLPFLLIASQNVHDLLLIIVYDVIDYLSFPVLYDLAGNESLPYLITTGVLVLLLIVMFSRSALRLRLERERIR